MMSRRTSATVTFQRHLIAAATTIELTDLVGPPTSRAARSPACCASTGLVYRAGQHHAFADAFDLDSRQGSLQGGAHAVEVAFIAMS